MSGFLGGSAGVTINSTAIIGGTDTRVLFDKAGVVGEDSGFTFDYTNKAITLTSIANPAASTLTLTGATALTTSKPVLSMTQTWSAVGTTFTAIKLNVTDTNSASGSLLLDFQVGSVSKFQVAKAGTILGISIGSGVLSSLDLSADPGASGSGNLNSISFRNARADNFKNQITFYGNGTTQKWAFGNDYNGNTGDNFYIYNAANGVAALMANTLDIGISANGSIGFSPTSSGALAASDVVLRRDNPDVLALRRSSNSQFFCVYNIFTDASNYEKANIGWSGNRFHVGTAKAGTGSARAMNFQTGDVSAFVIDTNQIMFPDVTLATNMTTGFINIPGAAGAPTGTPGTTTGFPLYWDSTNLQLYAYTGGAWKKSAAFT